MTTITSGTNRSLESRVSGLALTWLLMAGCGGGGGNASPPTTPPPSTNDPTRYGTLEITQDNADIVGFAVSLTEGALSVAQTAANEVVVFSSPSGLVNRDCTFGGSATIAHDDADTSFSISAGDSLTITYDSCYGDLVDGEMTGEIQVAINSYQVSDTSVLLEASVNIDTPLRIADRVDPALSSDLAAAFDLEFSLDPTEDLVVRAPGSNGVSITIEGITERISGLVMSRETRATVPGPGVGDVDMDVAFEFFYDSEILDGTATCETDPYFSLERGLISSANVLCRGLNASGVRTSGSEDISLDPEGDGSFTLLGRIEWTAAFDGFLRQPSGLNLEELFSAIATRRVGLAATDMFYDSSRDRLLVATSGSDTFSANSIVGVSLTQNTRTVLQTFAMEPSSLALSADGQLLYVGFTDRDEIRKYEASTLQLLSTFQIESTDVASSEYGVLDIAVSPIAAGTIAVSFNYLGTGVDDVTVFENDVQLPGRYRNAPGGNLSAGERLFFSEDGLRIHSYFQPSPGNTGAVDMTVDATGVAAAFSNFRFGFDLELSNGRLYSQGNEYDDETFVKVGTFGQGVRHIAVDPRNNHLYSESFDSLEVWDLQRRLPVANYELTFPFNSVTRMEMAGDYLVFVTDEDLRLLDSADIEPAAASECVASQQETLDGSAYLQFACDVIDAIYDPQADRLYAALSSDTPVNGNSIAVINHNSNTVETYIPVPSNPKRLSLSADGTRLYVIFADVELLVAIDTGAQAVSETWQTGNITRRTGYNELAPRKVLHMGASPVEPNTLVALTAEASNSVEKSLVAFRNGARLADEVPTSSLKSTLSNPYPRVMFEDTGALHALHEDSATPYVESLQLSATGLAATGAWFDAVDAAWFPREVSVKGSDAYFGSGDVVSIVNQTVERRFDFSAPPFTQSDPPAAVHPDPGSDEAWFLVQTASNNTELARFSDLDGSLIATSEFPFIIFGRNTDYSHASIFSIGADKLGLIIDERQGVFVIDKAELQ